MVLGLRGRPARVILVVQGEAAEWSYHGVKFKCVRVCPNLARKRDLEPLGNVFLRVCVLAELDYARFELASKLRCCGLS